MTKIANKMMVASAISRRRMEREEDYPESRRMPMYKDRYNYRSSNGMHEIDYAPNNTGYMTYYYNVDYPNEMRQQRNSDGHYMTSTYERNMRMNDDRMMYDDMPMIGFDRHYERGMTRNPRMHKEDEYNSYDGDIYARGSIMMKPYRKTEDDDDMRPVDEMTAMKWVKSMQHNDGTSGMKYKPEQTELLREQFCPECDKWSFFVAVNMMHADYSGVARKLGLDTDEFYGCMAKAFLCDKDAGRNKLRKYMTIIPK